jgi:hypothetical protein
MRGDVPDGGEVSGSVHEHHIDQIYRTVRTGFRSLATFGSVWAFTDALTVLAGQDTNVALSAILSFVGRVDVFLSFSLTAVCVIWALGERKLRQRAIQRLEQRPRDLERMIDPQRSTSGLTKTGETHPEDKD